MNDILFFDTETTGLGWKEEVIELCIIHVDGAVLFNRLFKPTVAQLTPRITELTGITPVDIVGASTFSFHWAEISRLITGNRLVGWNCGFDIRMILQSAMYANVDGKFCPANVEDLMHTVSSRLNLPGKYGGYQWLKLGDAAKELGVVPDGNLHRAMADTELTRQLYLKIREWTGNTPPLADTVPATPPALQERLPF